MDRAMMINSMKDSISEVLEQMFFLPIDFIDAQQGSADASPVPEAVMATAVGFSGSPSGLFRLTMPKALAETVTADFLGVLPDTLSDDQVGGTVKEMLNMLAGNALSAYAPQAVFDLQIPEMLTPVAMDEAAANSATVDIDIQTLDSRMTLQLVANNE